ncbi:protein of unknown function (plasmid) [Caballeronia sp. S22]
MHASATFRDAVWVDLSVDGSALTGNKTASVFAAFPANTGLCPEAPRMSQTFSRGGRDAARCSS